MSNSLQVKLLLNGADIIAKRPDRWQRFDYRTGTRVCAVGAMCEVACAVGMQADDAIHFFRTMKGRRLLPAINDIFGRRAAIWYMRKLATKL